MDIKWRGNYSRRSWNMASRVQEEERSAIVQGRSVHVQRNRSTRVFFYYTTPLSQIPSLLFHKITHSTGIFTGHRRLVPLPSKPLPFSFHKNPITRLKKRITNQSLENLLESQTSYLFQKFQKRRILKSIEKEWQSTFISSFYRTP